MKKAILLSSILTITYLQATPTEVKMEGIKYIKMLGKTLKSNLKKEMKADKSGVGAMNFCADKADSLTKKVNKKLPKNATVRRASIKYRNSTNKPDTLDSAVMQTIQNQMKNRGVNINKPLLVETPSSYRVYKPLFIKSVCLKCHGSKNDISPKIQKIIDTKYPNDLATGFEDGDLRGVIVSEIKK